MLRPRVMPCKYKPTSQQLEGIHWTVLVKSAIFYRRHPLTTDVYTWLNVMWNLLQYCCSIVSVLLQYCRSVVAVLSQYCRFNKVLFDRTLLLRPSLYSDIPCSSKFMIFLELCSKKTTLFKYVLTFSLQIDQVSISTLRFSSLVSIHFLWY